MKMFNISPSTVKYVRYKEVTTAISEGVLKVLNRAPATRSTSTIPRNIATNPRSFYYNTILDRYISEGSSRTPIIGPWDLKDGFVHWVNSRGDDMPFQMASTMKIVDGAGNPIALVNHAYRSMSKLIAGAPTMYRFLLYLYLNSEDLFSDSDNAKIVKDNLEKIISVYGLGYTFNLKNSDVDSILSVVSEEWLDRFFKELLNGRNDEEVEKFFDGDEKALESKIWNSLRDAVRGAFNTIRTDTDIGEMSIQFVKEAMNYSSITVENLRETLRNVIGIREEYDVDGKASSTEFYTSFRGMEFDGNDAFLWNKDVSKKFDSYVSTEVHAIDVNVKSLMKTLGIRADLIKTMPDALEEEIKESIMKGRYSKMNHADMLHVMTKIYTRRKYYLKVYNYDVIKIGESIHDVYKETDDYDEKYAEAILD